jgi:hypothetical protein
MDNPVNMELIKVMMMLGIAAGLIVTVAVWTWLDHNGGGNG